MKRIFTAFLIATVLCATAYAARRQHVQEATILAVAWTFFEGDDFDVDRITLKFSGAPTTAEDITVTIDSAQGAAYDTIIATLDPVGATEVVFANIAGLKAGDKLVVAYTNTDGNSITGVATCLIGQDRVDGPLAMYLDGAEVAGSFSVSSLPGGLTGYAEDAAHASGNIGLQCLTKRTDAAASSAGTDGDWATLNTDATGQLWTYDATVAADTLSIDAKMSTVIAALPGGNGAGYKSYIDTSFVTGDSPQTHDINTDLSRNGDQGFIAVDGAGNISVQISESGAVTTEDAIVLKNGETLSLDGWNVDQITVTWVTDSSYRIVMR